MRVKTMGASPLSGRIFQGTLNTEKGMWVGKREDVTDQAVRAVAEHGNDSNLLIVFYVQIMPDDFVMQLHRF